MSNKLNSYRIFMRDAKDKTRILGLNSKSVSSAMIYLSQSRNEIEEALGCKLKPKSAILLEVRGGRYGKH